MKSLVGQYECAHRSGLGLDYFTARLDRLTLQASGRFSLVVQEKSRISHAAQALASGQQANTNAPETRREGRYSSQGSLLLLIFDDGQQEQGNILEEGVQIDKAFFEKVSDSTMLPPTQRTKSNMEDIARGLKLAGAIGGTVIKAAKTIQDTLQTTPGQGTQNTQPGQAPSAPAQPTQPSQPSQAAPYQAPAQARTAQAASSSPRDEETLFCDQCGTSVRPGKRFCNTCGARLP